MEIFNNLPASVLQWFAIFISIIIEALPFVLLGTILSGFIEVYVTPDLVQRFLPRNRFYESFWNFYRFCLSVLRMWYCSHYHALLEKKFLVTPLFLSWQQLRLSTQSSFCHLFSFLEIVGRFLGLRLLGAIIVAITLGIMSICG